MPCFARPPRLRRGPQPQAAQPPPRRLFGFPCVHFTLCRRLRRRPAAITKKPLRTQKIRPTFVASRPVRSFSASSCADYVPYFLLMHRSRFAAGCAAAPTAACLAFLAFISRFAAGCAAAPTAAITKKPLRTQKIRPAFVASRLVHQLSASSCADYVPYFLLMHRSRFAAGCAAAPTAAITKKPLRTQKIRPIFVASRPVRSFSASSCADYVPYFLFMHRIAYTARKPRIL